MKRTIIIAILAIFGMISVKSQEKVKWYSIVEALEKSAVEPRVLMIDVYTDWCGWCKRMDASTFSDPEVVTILNRDFYPVKLDAEGKEDIVIGDQTFKFVDNGRRGYHELAAVLTQGRLSYPTLAYVGDGGKILMVSPGYRGPDQLKVFLAYFGDGTYKNQDWDSFAASYAEAGVQPAK